MSDNVRPLSDGNSAWLRQAEAHILHLLQDRYGGLFNRLPKAERCAMGVENMEGFYGGPMYKDHGKVNLV